MKNLMLSTAIFAASVVVANAEAHMNSTFRTEADPMEIHASEFIGMRVYTTEAEYGGDESMGIQQDWNDIGEINDVILSRDGQVEAVLLDIGGFLGMGERRVAVDMNAVKFVSDGETADNEGDFFLVVNAPRASLDDAPAYERNVDRMASADTNATVTTEQHTTQQTANVTTEPATTATGTEMAMDRPLFEREGYASAERETLTTEMLTGTRVYDANDEWIGEVSKLLLTDDGKLSQAVVDVGGFLGIGEKPVALDMNKLDILRQNDGTELRVYVSATKDELKALPDYDG